MKDGGTVWAVGTVGHYGLKPLGYRKVGLGLSPTDHVDQGGTFSTEAHPLHHTLVNTSLLLYLSLLAIFAKYKLRCSTI